MNRVFVISDTHFGHKKVVQFESEYRRFRSVEEHDAEIVRQWNSVVRKNDTVWHLGDVLFGEPAFETLGKLNGIKRLVLGNHDRYPAARYLEYFNSLHGCAEVRGCVLSHMPVSHTQFPRYKANIHGHTHHNTVGDERYICVCIEQIGLAPVLLDTVMLKVTHNIRGKAAAEGGRAFTE